MPDNNYLPIVITGMGIHCAAGTNVKEFTQTLRQGKSSIGYLTGITGDWDFPCIGAEIHDFSFTKSLEQCGQLPGDIFQKALQCGRRAPFPIQVAIISSLEAWLQAQLDAGPVSSRRMGIVVAGANLTQHYHYQLNQKFRQTPEYLNPTYALHFMDTDHIGTLSEILKIHGEGFTAGGASASGNVAIIKAQQAIQLGIVDICIVTGALADLSPMELQSFYAINALGGKSFRSDPKKACRPFDKKHEGFIYGQGSGCLVLESEASARKRGVPILARLAGGALNLDGNRFSAPNEDGEIQVMTAALAQAQTGPGKVDYINTHGTSTPLGDETEINAIKKVFKNRAAQVWLNSTKSFTGHCLYSAAVIEAIAVIIQMQEKFLHANLNLEEPIDDQCRFCPLTAIPAEIETAISNSFGFGGFATSIVIKKGE